MNTLDIIITAIVCVTAASGLWKGLVRQIFSLGGVILGYLIAREYYDRLSQFIPAADAGMKKVISFAGIFVFFILAAAIAGWFINRLLKSADLNWINRIGGGAVGFLKGVLIVVIITVLLLAFLPADSGILRESKLLPYAVMASRMLNSVIPKDMKDKYLGKVEEITSRWGRKDAVKEMRDDADRKERGHQ
jgi:membrane protein required for colicin V production